MMSWEWAVLMVLFGIVSTFEAIAILSAYFAGRIKLEQARRER